MHAWALATLLEQVNWRDQGKFRVRMGHEGGMIQGFSSRKGTNSVAAVHTQILFPFSGLDPPPKTAQTYSRYVLLN